MPNQVYLGFDFGLKRIGVAVGQTITHTAQPLKTLQAENGVPNWQDVEKIIMEWTPDGLVVGIPLNMDGTEQPITQNAKQFAKQLEKKFNQSVFEADERLTTLEARNQVFSQGGYKALQKTEMDSIAAKLILERWMDEEHEK